MLSISLLIVILIILILYTKKNNIKRASLTNIAETKQLLIDSYPYMKTGDLIFITDTNYKIKFVYFLQLEDSQIKIVQRKDSGYLCLESINTILNKYIKISEYKIVWFRMLEKITNEKNQELTAALNEFYPPSQPINVVLKLNTKSIDYFKCPFFIAKILLKLDLLKLGTNINCISDPSECLQELYKNSSFLITEQYRIDDIVELVDSQSSSSSKLSLL